MIYCEWPSQGFSRVSLVRPLVFMIYTTTELADKTGWLNGQCINIAERRFCSDRLGGACWISGRPADTGLNLVTRFQFTKCFYFSPEKFPKINFSEQFKFFPKCYAKMTFDSVFGKRVLTYLEIRGKWGKSRLQPHECLQITHGKRYIFGKVRFSSLSKYIVKLWPSLGPPPPLLS